MEDGSGLESLFLLIQVGELTGLNINRAIGSAFESIDCCFHSNNRSSDYIRALNKEVS